MINIKLVFKVNANSPATSARKEIDIQFTDEQWSTKKILADIYHQIELHTNGRGIYAIMVRNSNTALFEKLEQCFKNGQRPDPVLTVKGAFLTIRLERA